MVKSRRKNPHNKAFYALKVLKHMWEKELWNQPIKIIGSEYISKTGGEDKGNSNQL